MSVLMTLLFVPGRVEGCLLIGYVPVVLAPDMLTSTKLPTCLNVVVSMSKIWN